MPSLVSRVRHKAERMLGFEIRKKRSTQAIAWDALLALREYNGDNDEQESFIKFCKSNINNGNSQLFQDLFVLFETNSKTNGFFVEFGATDGVTLSNTFLLETAFGWNGILAEPARTWHDRLHQNRSCMIDTRCVTSESAQTVVFNETDWLELSTIEKWSSSDVHAKQRTGGKRYAVETISLNDLLDRNNAPHDIDYLSVDTEGSELEILTAFDFSKHSPRIITVEHNYTKNRNYIFELLKKHGYKRKFEELSLFDDWYVRR